jgi:hypothetical protein
MTRFAIGVVALLAVVPQVHADVRIAPVMGYIELSAGEVSCPSLPTGCLFCLNDENTTADHRLMLAIGATSPFIVTTGYAAGVIRPFIEIDGVRLTPDLFPCDAYLRCGVFWMDRFTPPACGTTPPGVTYTIGSMPEVAVTGDGSTHFTIPATEASEVPFEISVCSMFFYWGAGCNVSGSADKAWELLVPAAMNALAVPAGDAAPMQAPGSDFAIDFSSSSGGVLSISHVPADPPVGSAIDHLNGYWDVHSDLAPGTFTAQASFGFNAASLPPSVDPSGIAVAVYYAEMDMWGMLPTTVDVAGQTATATIDRASKFALVAEPALATKNVTWGALKAKFSPGTR